MSRTVTEHKTSLSRILAEKGLTRADLANMTGIPQGTINSVVSGYQKMVTERVNLVAAMLHIPATDLADIASPKAGVTLEPASKVRGRLSKRVPKVADAEAEPEPKAWSDADPAIEELSLRVTRLENRVAGIAKLVCGKGTR